MNAEDINKKLEEYQDIEGRKTVRQDVQNVKYYLNQWHRLKANINNLNEIEIVKGKVLFVSLSKLTQEERSLLAEKYSTSPRKTDKELANNMSVSLKDYGNNRRNAERKVGCYVKVIREILDDDLKEAVRMNCRK